MMDRQGYYRRLIAAHEKSGKSVREFCRTRNISPWTFYSWRKRLASADDPIVQLNGADQAHGFVRVAVDGDVPSDTPCGRIDVQLDCGALIRFPDALACSRMVEITRALRDGLR